VVAAVVLCFAQVRAEPLQVITFNAGLAEVAGQGLVACRKERLAAQMNQLPMSLSKHFVLLLQEIQGDDAESGYRKLAATRGYHVSRLPWKKRGIMTISSEPFRSEKFYPYHRDQWEPVMKRGVMEMEILFQNRLLHVFNTHTAFGNGEKPSQIHLEQLKTYADRVNRYADSVIAGGDFNLGSDLRYRDQTYDPARILWKEGLLDRLRLPLFEPPLAIGSYTSDQTRNPILSKKGLFRRSFRNATIDHILMSQDLVVRPRSSLIFNRHLPIQGCPKDSMGESPLSDHYGRSVWIEFDDGLTL
jgi:endonuclease/exonuclease/phosphatase family metal-dependent hydrolase